MNRIAYLASVMMVASAALPAVAKTNSGNDAEYAAVSSISPKTVYVGQAFEYTVTVTGNYPNISDARPDYSLPTEGVKFIGSPSRFGFPAEQTDRDKYEITVGDYCFVAKEEGKITIPGGEYILSVNVPVRQYDPFWGYFTASKTYRTSVKVPSASVKVKKLPSPPDDFSGAVGVFSIHTYLPDRAYTKERNLHIAFTIEGEGVLSDITAPDFMSLFKEPLRLKTVNPEERLYFKDDKLCSRIQYVCTFTALANGEVTIPALTFTFFDTTTGKYKTIESEPQTINIGGSGSDTKRLPDNIEYI